MYKRQDELDEKLFAAGILVAGQVLPVQLGLDRMHDHPRAEIVDPKIVAVTVPKLRDPIRGLFPREIIGSTIASGRVVFLLGNPQRDLRQMAEFQLALLFERVCEVIGLHHGEPDQTAEAETDDAVNAKSNGETKTLHHNIIPRMKPAWPESCLP